MLLANKKLLPIAQVLKSYGTEGACYLSLYSTMPTDINLKEPVFFYFEGLPVPFFIENLEKKGSNKAIIKFEGINTLDQAEELVGIKAFYPESLLKDDSQDDNLSLIGFTLLNQDSIELGIITEINDFSGNLCIEVGDNLYPLHEELIIALDEKAKTLQIEVPEGL